VLPCYRLFAVDRYSNNVIEIAVTVLAKVVVVVVVVVVVAVVVKLSLL
jgi:hypothetical protein